MMALSVDRGLPARLGAFAVLALAALLAAAPACKDSANRATRLQAFKVTLRTGGGAVAEVTRDGRIACGGPTCNAAEEDCCIDRRGRGCEPRDTCQGQKLACSGARSCASGQLCCLTQANGVTSSACAATCDPEQRQLCHSDGECGTGLVCERQDNFSVCIRPFSATPIEFSVDIEAVDTRGERVAGYDGLVQVGVVPGQLSGVNPSNPVRLSDGRLENVRVSFRRSAGPTRITVAARSCEGGGEVCAQSFNAQAVGATTTMYFQNPRIRDVQQSDTSRDSSPFELGIVTVDRGRNIVAHVSNSGFSVVDRDDNEYNSIFAYNFSRPEGIRRGDRLRSFSGQVVEFLGYTELSFPLWDVDFRCPNNDDPNQLCDEGQFCVEGKCLGQECGDRICAEGSVCENNACVPNRNVPDPAPIDAILGQNRELEKFEGGLVSLQNVMTTQEFVDCDNPTQNPGANGDGVCQFCRSCGNNRDANGACPAGRCCPIPQVCNTPVGECTQTCDADRGEDGKCPTGKNCCIDGACNFSLGAMLFPAQNPPNTETRLGICGGCTVAEKAEQLCESRCNGRQPPQTLCTNYCDYRDFNQYRAGVTDHDGNWTGQTILLNTRDTLSTFRPDAAENLGRRFSSMKGVLSNIFAPTAFWILTPRDECDVVGLTMEERRRTDCDTVK